MIPTSTVALGFILLPSLPIVLALVIDDLRTGMPSLVQNLSITTTGRTGALRCMGPMGLTGAA